MNLVELIAEQMERLREMGGSPRRVRLSVLLEGILRRELCRHISGVEVPGNRVVAALGLSVQIDPFLSPMEFIVDGGEPPEREPNACRWPGEHAPGCECAGLE